VRFTADQRFARADADQVARAFADPALYEVYPAGPRLAAPEVVRHQVHGDVVEQDLRYRFVGDLSAAVRAVVDPSRLSWVQRSRHDLAARRTTYELLPDHYADRLRCAGAVSVEPDGEGCRRLVTGDLKVRVALVAGTVERTLVGDLQDHLRAEVAIVEAFLARRDG
jgi:hypothetical protein